MIFTFVILPIAWVAIIAWYTRATWSTNTTAKDRRLILKAISNVKEVEEQIRLLKRDWGCDFDTHWKALFWGRDPWSEYDHEIRTLMGRHQS